MSRKNEVEALLFSSGRAMEINDIARICRADADEIKKSLEELRKEYDDNQKPLLLVQDGTKWKLTVRESYSHIAEKVVSEVELSKTLIETLAIIAWKAPILQSGVIKMRTNKAYDHIKALEDSGFISKKKHGRSFMLNLGQKFYDYFDLKGKDAILKTLGSGIQEAKKAQPETKSDDIEDTKAAVAKLFEAMNNK